MLIQIFLGLGLILIVTVVVFTIIFKKFKPKEGTVNKVAMLSCYSLLLAEISLLIAGILTNQTEKVIDVIVITALVYIEIIIALAIAINIKKED